jgi:hypothetical protein
MEYIASMAHVGNIIKLRELKNESKIICCVKKR